MKLYKVDFNIVSDGDSKLWEELKEKEIVNIDGNPTKITKSLYREYPKSVRHYLSLFPNNFIDAVDLMSNKDSLLRTLSDFEILLNEHTISEREILNFINQNEAFFIIGSIVKNNYRFGHHALFLFPEFKIGTSYQADYLLVGENSHGYHFVFVELENPYNSITTHEGAYGQTIRKGIAQIQDWEHWLEQNFSSLKMEFEKYQKKEIVLPKEFRDFDKTRIHFVVVAGRRDNYNAKTQRLNRKLLEESKILMLHYDNLIESSKETIGSSTY